MAKRRKSRFKRLFTTTVVCAGIIGFAVVLFVQTQKLNSINAQISELETRKTELAIEEQRLMLMLSYVESDAFIYEYAHHKLGYTTQNEVLFGIK